MSNRDKGVAPGLCAALLSTVVAAACSAPVAVWPVGFHQAWVAAGDGVLVRLAADACHSQPYQVRVSESAGEVRIALSAAASDGPPAAACSDVVTVRLKEPLGVRRLVDATTDREVSRSAGP